MSDINVIKYTIDRKKEWNEFLSASRNGHFMLDRNYMDYHSDRFQDESLMFYSDKNKLIAILPANIDGDTLYSHQGLSFGGMIYSDSLGVGDVCSVFDALLKNLKDNGIKKLIYKRIPDFYHCYPSQEDLYSLFLNNANLIRRDVSSLINLSTPLKYQTIRTRMIKKAIKSGVCVREEKDFYEFWNVLSDTLLKNHNVNPVHSLAEIEKLRNSFPENIKCYVAVLDEQVVAGVLVFKTNKVLHTQYLASSEEGRKVGGLDMVIDYLIQAGGVDYLSFGISTENNGRYLNSGLVSQKEGFGARSFVQDFYELTI